MDSPAAVLRAAAQAVRDGSPPVAWAFWLAAGEDPVAEAWAACADPAALLDLREALGVGPIKLGDQYLSLMRCWIGGGPTIDWVVCCGFCGGKLTMTEPTHTEALAAIRRDVPVVTLAQVVAAARARRDAA